MSNPWPQQHTIIHSIPSVSLSQMWVQFLLDFSNRLSYLSRFPNQQIHAVPWFSLGALLLYYVFEMHQFQFGCLFDNDTPCDYIILFSFWLVITFAFDNWHLQGYNSEHLGLKIWTEHGEICYTVQQKKCEYITYCGSFFDFNSSIQIHFLLSYNTNSSSCCAFSRPSANGNLLIKSPLVVFLMDRHEHLPFCPLGV